MAQTLDALHTSLSRGRAWSAKEASMRKQAGCRNTGIHHVGLCATSRRRRNSHRCPIRLSNIDRDSSVSAGACRARFSSSRSIVLPK